MRLGSLVIILLCAACAKKPAAKAPTSDAPQTVEPKAAEPAPEREKKASPTSTKKPGDPCSGGE